jgi:AcrR family transcriptional regulator
MPARNKRPKATPAVGKRAGRGPSKGERTRLLIFRSALALFEEKGFDGTTLRDIASRAGVSLGLLYRYFPGKDALVLELYEDLTEDFLKATAALPAATWPVRAMFALRASLEVLGTHRESLRALLGTTTIEREGPLLVPGRALPHARVEARFVEAVTGATDAPADSERLGRSLYLVHLVVLLFWLLDRSPRQVATDRALSLLDRCAPLISQAANNPMVAGLGVEIGKLLELGVLGGSETSSGPGAK